MLALALMVEFGFQIRLYIIYGLEKIKVFFPAIENELFMMKHSKTANSGKFHIADG
jgi:hypothetical protein